MQLKDVMTPEVEVIAPEASIYEAAEKMSHRDIGPLPVCEGERLVGMLTDRDITVRAVAAGRDPRTTQVREVMTPNVVYGASARHTSCGTLYKHDRGQVRGWKGVYTSRGAEDTTLWRR